MFLACDIFREYFYVSQFQNMWTEYIILSVVVNFVHMG